MNRIGHLFGDGESGRGRKRVRLLTARYSLTDEMTLSVLRDGSTTDGRDRYRVVVGVREDAVGTYTVTADDNSGLSCGALFPLRQMYGLEWGDKLMAEVVGLPGGWADEDQSCILPDRIAAAVNMHRLAEGDNGLPDVDVLARAVGFPVEQVAHALAEMVRREP